MITSITSFAKICSLPSLSWAREARHRATEHLTSETSDFSSGQSTLILPDATVLNLPSTSKLIEPRI